MIKNIHLKNFKAAADLHLEVRPLTILTGLNGSGKSSTLQAIALVNQSQNQSGFLCLKGTLVNLGRCEDVLFESAEANQISIEIESEHGVIAIDATCNPGEDQLKVQTNANRALIKRLFKPGFQFLQADRIIPASLYGQADFLDRQSGWLGIKGELAVDYLARNRDVHVRQHRRFDPTGFDIAPELMLQIAPTASLQDQTSAWLQCISPGVKPVPDVIELNDTSALRFMYTGTSVSSESRAHRPVNVGFGITYCLPIIVACLSAKKGSLLMIENPEAHLHPMGQFALGCLIARSAKDGVQIIVETHSDHLMNGVRVEVKRNNIKEKSVIFHYFDRNVETGRCRTEPLFVFPNGKMNNWPKGFFDQWSNALDILLDD